MTTSSLKNDRSEPRQEANDQGDPLLIGLGLGKWCVAADLLDGTPALFFRGEVDGHTPGEMVPWDYMQSIPLRAIVTFADQASYRRFLGELPHPDSFPADVGGNAASPGSACEAAPDASDKGFRDEPNLPPCLGVAET
jgi:hypothetical protein